MYMTQFRKIIIIRHGFYDSSTDRLNEFGASQMRKLIDPLKKILENEENVLLLSSSAERAEDSVRILSDMLKIKYEAHPYFWSDNMHPQDNFRAKELLIEKAAEKNSDVVVLVTHLEYADELPGYLVAEVGKSFIGYVSINKGEMLFIDMENETTMKY